MNQANKEQHKNLNRVENFLENSCSGDEHQQSYTASNNTYKRKKTDVDITGEENNTDFVYGKHCVSGSKPF